MPSCGHCAGRPISRREMLRQCAMGFGGIALTALLGDKAYSAIPSSANPPQFRARARNVIFLYMDGGVSQVDSFDPKPRLTADHGKPFAMKMEPTQFNNNGNTLGSPWAFQQYGQSGLPVSDLFPHVARCADDLCVVRSMASDFSEHHSANYFLHTGHGQQGRPSFGAWTVYGLGSENNDLPGYIVLDGGLVPSGGAENFGAGFLPANNQASIFRNVDPPLANIQSLEMSAHAQAAVRGFTTDLDRDALARSHSNPQLEAAIANYELAFRMQTSVPGVANIDGETDATKRLYGMESEFQFTRAYGRQCLIARRLVERGVRFVELTCPHMNGIDRWDAHSALVKNHGDNALATDQPIAGLLMDLKARGLLDETLVLWAGEFG
ncbi:MAG: DUF1501 domain-containing protein, partial [Candidatus Hydrogenedentes bacterium]|nr:DUF1501 domain-containing protein [Candidatus Hydrogenedentota bacterium]